MFITKMFSYGEGLLFVIFSGNSVKTENEAKRVGFYVVRIKMNLISSSKKEKKIVLVCS